MVSHNLTDSVQWQSGNFSSHRSCSWTVSNPAKVSQHHWIVYLHFSCVEIPTANSVVARALAGWLEPRYLTWISQLVPPWPRVKDIFYCVGPVTPSLCFGCGAAQLSPYSRPGLTVISPPALLTNRRDCFSTIWDRQVTPPSPPSSQIAFYWESWYTIWKWYY